MPNGPHILSRRKGFPSTISCLPVGALSRYGIPIFGVDSFVLGGLVWVLERMRFITTLDLSLLLRSPRKYHSDQRVGVRTKLDAIRQF